VRCVQTVAFHTQIPPLQQKSVPFKQQKCPPFYVKFPKEPSPTFQIPVYSFKRARQMDTIQLPHDIFGVPVRTDILHRVVTWHLSCQRQGTASTKRRGEVRGSGRKIAPQKGLGKARVGENRTPIRRGGGRAHGPKPRYWHYPLPKRVRQLGLKHALSSKYAQNKLFVIDQTDLKTHKTKNLLQILRRFKWTSNILFVEKKVSPFMYLAHRNIPHIDYVPEEQLTVYDILRYDTIVLHRNTLAYIKKRVGLLENGEQTPIVTPPQDNTITSEEKEKHEDYDHIVEEGEEDESEHEDFNEFLRKETGGDQQSKSNYV